MLRTLLTVAGVIEVLAPNGLIDAAERIALADPDECERRSWVVPAARAEGLVYLSLARDDAAYSKFKRVLGIVGVLLLVFPRGFVRYSTEIAYTDAGRCAWKPWVYPLARLVGLLYVLVALDDLRKR